MILAGLLAVWFFVASAVIRDIPQAGKWDNPTIQDLAVARNAYRLAGGPYGNAEILLERYQRYEAYIVGGVDDLALCGLGAD